MFVIFPCCVLSVPHTHFPLFDIFLFSAFLFSNKPVLFVFVYSFSVCLIFPLAWLCCVSLHPSPFHTTILPPAHTLLSTTTPPLLSLSPSLLHLNFNLSSISLLSLSHQPFHLSCFFFFFFIFLFSFYFVFCLLFAFSFCKNFPLLFLIHSSPLSLLSPPILSSRHSPCCDKSSAGISSRPAG